MQYQKTLQCTHLLPFCISHLLFTLFHPRGSGRKGEQFGGCSKGRGEQFHSPCSGKGLPAQTCHGHSMAAGCSPQHPPSALLLEKLYQVDIHECGTTTYTGHKKSLCSSRIWILLVGPQGKGSSNLPCKDLCALGGQSTCSRSRVPVLFTASFGEHSYLSLSPPVPSARAHARLLWDQMSFGLSHVPLTCYSLSLLSFFLCLLQKTSCNNSGSHFSPNLPMGTQAKAFIFRKAIRTYIYVCVRVQLKIAEQSNSPAPFDMPQGKRSWC